MLFINLIPFTKIIITITSQQILWSFYSEILQESLISVNHNNANKKDNTQSDILMISIVLYFLENINLRISIPKVPTT